jgi:hypothetical protein
MEGLGQMGASGSHASLCDKAPLPNASDDLCHRKIIIVSCVWIQKCKS